MASAYLAGAWVIYEATGTALEAVRAAMDQQAIRTGMETELKELLSRYKRLTAHLRNQDREVPIDWSEMAQFMEYLGAPADVGYGRRRAELGHPQPWTEVFDHIHVESFSSAEGSSQSPWVS